MNLSPPPHQAAAVYALPGWAMSARIWTELVTQESFPGSLTGVDLPGFGRSPLAVGSYSVADVAASAVSGTTAPSIWMGWSLGGMVAMHIAARYPDRVKALVLVAASPRFVRAGDWPNAMDPAVLAAFAQEVEKDHRGALRRFLLLQAGSGAHGRELARHLARHVFDGTPPNREALRGGLEILRAADLRASLKAIRCPTLVILGERDTLVPVVVQHDLCRLRPDWDIRVIPGSGHAPFLSHPATFSALVERFFDGLS